jgi:signal transduction histidine kinase
MQAKKRHRQRSTDDFVNPLHDDRRPQRVAALRGGGTAPEDRRELALMSLLEMGRELAFSVDLFETVDLLMFSLMGQLGTARSAFWILGGEDETGPILLRSHGFQPEAARKVGKTCSGVVRRQLEEMKSPILSSWLVHTLEPAHLEDLQRNQFEMFAPLISRGRLLGWLALGPRVDGRAHRPSDMQLLEAALGMVASSLQSALLLMSVQESNRQLRAANDRLEELHRLKTEFMDNVNHELRTPVTVVIGTLECLATVLKDHDQASRLLDGAVRRADDLRHLLETLLTFSDASHARLVINVESTDVGALVDDFVKARRPGVTSQFHELHYARGAVPVANCDPLRLRQVLDELVDNAVKFTPQGSHIWISLEAIEREASSWLRVGVTDDGPGIPANERPRLFESFHQGDGSMVRRAGGLGLGLAVAREVMERMGGRLELSDEAETGARFEVLLPTAHAAEGAASEPAGRDAAGIDRPGLHARPG